MKRFLNLLGYFVVGLIVYAIMTWLTKEANPLYFAMGMIGSLASDFLDEKYGKR